MTNFFHRIERHDRRIVFEPRGETWHNDLLRQLTTDLDLVHCVDPFLRNPVGCGLRYFRLHGRPAYHYRYRYTDHDLEQLKKMLIQSGLIMYYSITITWPSTHTVFYSSWLAIKILCQTDMSCRYNIPAL
jgi:uncharacterized protein YecE (DUF72 family)